MAYCHIWHPIENSYSDVPESKIVEPKDPAVGQTVKVKEGTKTFSGKVEAIGTKAELEMKLCDLDKEEKEEEPVPAATTTESGTAACRDAYRIFFWRGDATDPYTQRA